MKKILYHIALMSLLALPLVVPASGFSEEQQPEKHRPKIALVLGGGGARGAAHVGVLKVLEENRVPVDIVIGTSMGSIVGGLYCSGMSPEQIEKKFKEIDWIDLFRSRPDEQYVSFRRKKDMTRLASVEFGLQEGKITIPRGLIQGQKLDFEMEALGIPVSDIQDFDGLPIPFRAVAADLGSGEPVVLSSGSLSQAMRASMSIPGVFPPVQIEGRVLIDGGIAANVPIEVAKRMGADIIIAVNVGQPANPDPREVKSAIEVTMQMISLLTDQNVKQSLSLIGKEDILIVPELGDITTASFTKVPEAIAIGDKAARSMKDRLSRFSLSEEEYRDHLARRRKPLGREQQAVVLDFVRVEGLKRVNPDAVKGRIRTRAGQALDLNVLKDDLTKVYAMGDFETINFEVVEEKGKKGLVVKALEKPWGPDYLRFGLNFSADSKSDSAFTGLVEYRMTQLNRLGAEWRNMLEFGEMRSVLSEWYQPLDVQDYFFTQAHLSMKRDLRPFFIGDELIAKYQADFSGGGWDVGVNYRSYARALVGIRKGVTDVSAGLGGSVTPVYDNIEEGALVMQIEYDQLDNHLFPHSGSRSLLTYYSSQESLGADLKYDKAELNLDKAWTFHKRNTLFGHLGLGVTRDEDAPLYDQFSIGGFMKLSGYGEDQLRGQDMAYGGIYYYYRAGTLGLFYIGGGLECGNAWSDRSEAELSDLLWGSLLFVGMDTPLGPLYFGYGLAEEGQGGRLHLYLGQTF